MKQKPSPKLPPIVIAAIITLIGTVITALVGILPSEFLKSTSTPLVVPPQALEAELAKGNISLTEVPDKLSLVRQWLIEDPQYQTMSQTIRTVLAGQRVINQIPIDVIIGKYRIAMGGTASTNFPPDQYKEIEKTKKAMFDTWKERHPNFPQQTFDEIVETVQ